MSRVRFVYLGRALLSPKMIKAIVFLASVISCLVMVSIVSVVKNMAQLSFWDYFSYVSNSYVHTSLNVQSALLLGLCLGAWLLWDFVGNFRHERIVASVATN